MTDTPTPPSIETLWTEWCNGRTKAGEDALRILRGLDVKPEHVAFLLASLDPATRARVLELYVSGEVRRRDFEEALQSVRGFDDPCDSCQGAGVRSYSSTATWRGGFGGQMFTVDVCDACWGSGDKHRHGTDLRKLYGELSAARAEVERLKSELSKALEQARWTWEKETSGIENAKDGAWFARRLETELSAERAKRERAEQAIATHRETLVKLEMSASAWEPGARLLGNITAQQLCALAFDLLRNDEPPTPPTEAERCRTCNGSGETLDFCGSCWSKCQVCKGTGRSAGGEGGDAD